MEYWEGCFLASLGFGGDLGAEGGDGIGLFEILLIGALLFGVLLVHQEETSGSPYKCILSEFNGNGRAFYIRLAFGQ